MKYVFGVFLIAILILSCSDSKKDGTPSPTSPNSTVSKFPFPNLKDTLPSGWAVTDQDSTPFLCPEGLRDPLFYFELTDTIHKAPFGLDSVNPYMDLYFFSINDSVRVDSVIQAQSVYSWCTPKKYAKSAAYYIVYTSCYRTNSVWNDNLDANLVPYFQHH